LSGSGGGRPRFLEKYIDHRIVARLGHDRNLTLPCGQIVPWTFSLYCRGTLAAEDGFSCLTSNDTDLEDVFEILNRKNVLYEEERKLREKLQAFKIPVSRSSAVTSVTKFSTCSNFTAVTFLIS